MDLLLNGIAKDSSLCNVGIEIMGVSLPLPISSLPLDSVPICTWQKEQLGERSVFGQRALSGLSSGTFFSVYVGRMPILWPKDIGNFWSSQMQ